MLIKVEDGVNDQARRPYNDFIRIPFSPTGLAPVDAVLTILRGSVLFVTGLLTPCGAPGKILARASRLPCGLAIVSKMSKGLIKKFPIKPFGMSNLFLTFGAKQNATRNVILPKTPLSWEGDFLCQRVSSEIRRQRYREFSKSPNIF